MQYDEKILITEHYMAVESKIYHFVGKNLSRRPNPRCGRIILLLLTSKLDVALKNVHNEMVLAARMKIVEPFLQYPTVINWMLLSDMLTMTRGLPQSSLLGPVVYPPLY